MGKGFSMSHLYFKYYSTKRGKSGRLYCDVAGQDEDSDGWCGLKTVERENLKFLF